MNYNIVDIIIIVFIFMGGLLGFKQGAFKSLIRTIGIVLVVVIAFLLKNRLSTYFYENLPFLDLWGVFKGVQILNVIFYEVLAFLIIASILMIIYRLLLGITGLIENVLKATIILSIPSKILGFFVGLIENYIWAYVILFILTLPVVNVRQVYESRVANFIMKETPYLSKYTKKTVDVYNDIYEVVATRNEKNNKQINEESMDLMLKYDMISVESAEKLIKRNKVSVNNDSFLDKYKNK